MTFASYDDIRDWYHEFKLCPVCCEPSGSGMLCDAHSILYRSMRGEFGMGKAYYRDFVNWQRGRLHPCGECEAQAMDDDYLCAACRDRLVA